jgi:DNA-binding transcriptional regulator GbsR (MarR family)
MPQDDLQNFTETLTKIYIASGLPHSMSKVLVYLTLCIPAQQTAPDIQKNLALSAGSVSTALNSLVRTGLIARSKKLGDKHYFYELDSDAWERSIMQRLESLDYLVELAQQGIALMPNNKRLIAMHDIYLYFGNEFKDLMRRYTGHKRPQ